MKHKIAIPVSNHRLCAHFGHCDEFAVIETEDGKIVNESSLAPPLHQPGILPGWLASQGITHVIAGGMGQRAIILFEQQGIQIMVGAVSKTARELVEDFLNNRLATGVNACDH